MTSISSTRSLILDLPPSCIAFCPTQPRFFVVGTYHLHDSTTVNRKRTPSSINDEAPEDQDGTSKPAQTRSGSLILYELNGNEILTIATSPTPDFAILDAKWSPHTTVHGGLLAVATSTGSLAFYDLSTDQSSGTKGLVLRCSKRVCEPSVLVLSLAWHPRRANVVGVTLSDGRVCLCSCESETWAAESTVGVAMVHEHSLEAWTLAFTTGSDDDGLMGILSGGDDVVLQLSTRDGSAGSTPRWQDRKIHQAGVTAILPLGPDLVVTGSYDDRIRLILAPFTAGRRQVLAELDFGGGVWRLALLSGLPNPEGGSSTGTVSSGNIRSLFILASCMHAGTRIVKLSRGEQVEDDWTFEVLALFEEHKSMNYGSDVQPSEGSMKNIVSTSFYDRLLCLWRFDVGGQ
ncbi:hypothetical protein LTR91_023698 [Friedmanniomyces endolithicus]|uniref:Uncharacterized protein n=1 Tax=Friedmanniomyces endolithicus TaxID=329885 RepID=A0AAN6H400_9PEZI|nr:hypothetical protein LTR94_011524 [Friedmanniomyces endolithicus]KAK0793330.1 hypothetical protein LTR59_008242 [Friedmanniomyces endolithicus]KAK0795718.1 hypothetical protein LTR38_008821 [Friedmanniomyces endolithicus]KAK0806763.1 hypothetical protein LTR75_006894 [Friedmanniomyces endolithicus]KAK0858831.1 hypothetical protein LTR87_017739 [Friedmanniomyces endolithicus]